VQDGLTRAIKTAADPVPARPMREFRIGALVRAIADPRCPRGPAMASAKTLIPPPTFGFCGRAKRGPRNIESRR